MKTKICSKCKEEKPLEDFRNDKYGRLGKTARCKQCLSRLPKDWNPEIRCYYCHKWFNRRQRNWKFCTKKCHDRYWARNFNLSVKGTVWNAQYRRKYKLKDGDKCIDCNKPCTNDATRCTKCHCLNVMFPKSLPHLKKRWEELRSKNEKRKSLLQCV